MQEAFINTSILFNIYFMPLILFIGPKVNLMTTSCEYITLGVLASFEENGMERDMTFPSIPWMRNDSAGSSPIVMEG